MIWRLLKWACWGVGALIALAVFFNVGPLGQAAIGVGAGGWWLVHTFETHRQQQRAYFDYRFDALEQKLDLLINADPPIDQRLLDGLQVVVDEARARERELARFRSL